MMAEGLRWFAPSPGVRMPWVVLGRADGREVVALPGLSDGLMPLSEVGPHVVGSARSSRRVPFRVLTLSHRHPLEHGITTRDLARDAAAFVEAQVDGPAVVVGHSMGGMVAQWLAADRPDLVAELVLTATLARPVPSFTDRLRAWEELVAQHRWRAFAAAANEASYTGSELLRRRILLRVSRPPVVPHLVDRHRVLTSACLTHDATQVLGQIRCPTLVLSGAADPLVPPTASRGLAEAIPGAVLEELDGLAHGFPEQAPRRTFAAVARHMGLGEAVA
jgi:pimeloyl-ACP methyl ester carboxylesterase